MIIDREALNAALDALQEASDKAEQAAAAADEALEKVWASIPAGKPVRQRRYDPRTRRYIDLGVAEPFDDYSAELYSLTTYIKSARSRARRISDEFDRYSTYIKRFVKG